MSPPKFFRTIITYSFYLLFFLTPLILTTSNFELFEFPKMLFVYVMTTIIAAAWAGLWIVQRKITIRKTPFDYFFIFFLISQVLSTIFSIHPYTSIFGYYSRFHGGLLSSICYLILFYAFVSNAEHTTKVNSKQSSVNSNKNKKLRITDYRLQITNSKAINYQTTLFLLLASASLVAIYGIAEHFGIDAQFWVQDVQNRVFSTLGQPNWLAAFLTALIPITMAWGLRPPKTKFPTGISLLLLNTLTAYGLTSLVFSKTLPTTLLSIIFFLTLFSAGVFLINNLLDQIHKKIFQWGFLNFYLLFALFVTTVLFTKSRSGILAMLVSFGVFWILIFLQRTVLAGMQGPSFSKKPPLPIKHFLAFSFMLLALCLVIGTEWTNWRVARSLWQVATKKNTQQLVQTDSHTPSATRHEPKYAPHISKSTDIRKAVWEGAIKVWQNWPLTGSGVETFAYSFYNFRPRSHNDVSEWDFLYNKAHNEYLNLLATTGILGTTAIFSIILVFFYLNLSPAILDSRFNRENRIPFSNYLLRITYYVLPIILSILLIYLIKPQIFRTLVEKLIIHPPLLKPLGIAMGLALIFVVFILRAESRRMRDKVEKSLTIFHIALISSMLAIIITNFYGFSVVIVGLLFFSLCAFSVDLQGQSLRPARTVLAKSWGDLTSSQWLYLSLISLISLIALIKTYNYWRADYLFNKGKNLAKSGQMLSGMQILEKAISLRPKEALYHSELGESYTIAALSLKAQNATASAQEISFYSQKAVKETEKTLELNSQHINFYKSAAKIYLTLAQIDPNFYQKAIEALEKGWQLSPTDPKLPYNLGIIAKALGKNEEAEIFLQKTVELRPAYRKAWLDLGEIKTKLDKKDKAAKAYQFILKNIDPEDKLAKKLLEKL